MKVIAVIPKQYSENDYILQLNADELAAIAFLTSSYYEVKVVNNIEKREYVRKIKELQVGDIIDKEWSKDIREQLSYYISNRTEIEKSFTTLRGAMTKLENLTTSKETKEKITKKK